MIRNGSDGMLEIQSKAIDFTLPDEQGVMHSLHDYKGKRIVLYFYPKDNTPGCTRQACAFKAAYEDFRRQDIVVIGISKDSIASHKKFKEAYDLPFILLSDKELEVIKAYDVWKEKKLYGRTYMGVTRSTYVINEDGIIIKCFEKADPANNAADILQFLNNA